MKCEKTTMKIMNNVTKFIAVAFLCFSCILVSSHYYRIKNHTAALYKDLNVIIFFDENIKEDTEAIKKIESENLVFIKEYVNATEAYSKAIENNPFLKDVSVPDDAKSIQAYAIATPKFIPEESSLLNMKKTFEEISGVDEVVFDTSLFERYAKAKNLLSFYKKIFFIFEIVILALFIFKCIFFIVKHKQRTKIFVMNVFMYLLYSIVGFLAFWILCIYTHCPLLIDGIAVLSIIPSIAALGIVLS